MRDDFGHCIGLYPIPKAQYERLNINGELYITFRLATGHDDRTQWDDLRFFGSSYNTSDIWVIQIMQSSTIWELLNTTNEGMANAIKSTANLEGFKSTKAMLSEEDRRKQKETYVED
jgi:hypothetical protein